MKKKLIVALIALTVVIAALIFFVSSRNGSQTPNHDVPLDISALDTLPKRNASNVDLSHLDTSLAPPTNSWMSGMALQKSPKAVFPLPLSFKPDDTGYAIGLPTVTTTARLITAPHTPALSVSFGTARGYTLTRYDKLSATLTYASGGKSLADVTIAHGSPYIFTSARTDLEAHIDGVKITKHDDRSARVSAAGGDYGIVISGNGKLTTSGDTIEMRLSTDASLATYAIPTGESDELKKYAGNILESTDYTYNNATDTSRTTLTYHTRNNQPTIIGSLPHQQSGTSNTLPFSYGTLYGLMTLSVGNELSYSTKRMTATNQLDLSKLQAGEKSSLRAQLQKDAASLTLEKEDTYFGGKEMYRAANLLDIAHQLDDKSTATTIQNKLRGAVDVWFADNTDMSRTTRYFYYDTSLKSVVGETAAFGSEDANDHHFHYAYFIYAASVLARYDNSFLDQHRSDIDTLVADIALNSSRDKLAQMRSYDPYMGHSWASGLAPFDDGNNQESSSEAINAWAAVGAWAAASNNTALAEQATWQLSNEIHSAETYWTGFDASSQLYENYTEPVIALNWGGKREYGTFFSPEPSAMLGIQLIPMNPSMTQLPTSKDRIQSNIARTIQSGRYDVQFGDYIAMYEALADKDAALKHAQTLPDKTIDDGNSRTYMYAWILSR